MITLRETAPAKVNLYLHITGKRADGYHLLDSLVVFTNVGDGLEVVPSEKLHLTIEGPYAGALDAENNSIIHAAKTLQKHAGVKTGAAITLSKQLPVASGIGGGTADAAAALRLLQRLWKLDVAKKDMDDIALGLGADVPACLLSSTLYMTGIGEKTHRGPPLSGLPLVLANPGSPLVTAKVFKELKSEFSGPARHPPEFVTHQACVDYLRKTRNDLQLPALALMPEIGEVLRELAALKGCTLSRMSGSGATCFGVFTDAQAAKEAGLHLSSRHPKWWVKAASVL